jgi:hypothetical protein
VRRKQKCAAVLSLLSFTSEGKRKSAVIPKEKRLPILKRPTISIMPTCNPAGLAILETRNGKDEDEVFPKKPVNQESR